LRSYEAVTESARKIFSLMSLFFEKVMFKQNIFERTAQKTNCVAQAGLRFDRTFGILLVRVVRRRFLAGNSRRLIVNRPANA
jgi:hypothetical protein